MAHDITMVKKLRHVLAARASEANVPGPLRHAGKRRSGSQVTMQDDGFHFAEFANHSHKLFYVEWWYYNFVDPDTGLSGMVTFAICNPGNELDLGTASLNFAAFTPEGEVETFIEFYHVTHFKADTACANVSIANSSVKVVDADTYQITAANEEGSMSLDLVFHRKGRSQLLADNVPGYAGWEVSSWLVYMPSAEVTGSVRLGSKTYALKNAKGYHDHDWGMWMLPERIWSWAQFSTPDHEIAFDVGFHAAFQKSTAYFRWQDKDIYFPQDRFQTTQSDWASWRVFWTYPKQVAFTAVDATGQYQIELTWTVTQTSVLWKYPLLVFEQACDFTGRLSEYDMETGKPGKELLAISTPGFCEFTDRWIGGHQ